ncbi:hypothetical protein GQ42DRAFT_160575 [Ramicandelaber brevisporus]|nr:hypothetical protein GQ42DRAFT_160575 [Ramicandelaber brevisporus]
MAVWPTGFHVLLDGEQGNDSLNICSPGALLRGRVVFTWSKLPKNWRLYVVLLGTERATVKVKSSNKDTSGKSTNSSSSSSNSSLLQRLFKRGSKPNVKSNNSNSNSNSSNSNHGQKTQYVKSHFLVVSHCLYESDVPQFAQLLDECRSKSSSTSYSIPFALKWPRVNFPPSFQNDGPCSVRYTLHAQIYSGKKLDDVEIRNALQFDGIDAVDIIDDWDDAADHVSSKKGLDFVPFTTAQSSGSDSRTYQLQQKHSAPDLLTQYLQPRSTSPTVNQTGSIKLSVRLDKRAVIPGGLLTAEFEIDTRQQQQQHQSSSAVLADLSDLSHPSLKVKGVKYSIVERRQLTATATATTAATAASDTVELKNETEQILVSGSVPWHSQYVTAAFTAALAAAMSSSEQGLRSTLSLKSSDSYSISRLTPAPAYTSFEHLTSIDHAGGTAHRLIPMTPPPPASPSVLLETLSLAISPSAPYDDDCISAIDGSGDLSRSSSMRKPPQTFPSSSPSPSPYSSPHPARQHQQPHPKSILAMYDPYYSRPNSPALHSTDIQHRIAANSSSQSMDAESLISLPVSEPRSLATTERTGMYNLDNLQFPGSGLVSTTSIDGSGGRDPASSGGNVVVGVIISKMPTWTKPTHSNHIKISYALRIEIDVVQKPSKVTVIESAASAASAAAVQPSAPRQSTIEDDTNDNNNAESDSDSNNDEYESDYGGDGYDSIDDDMQSSIPVLHDMPHTQQPQQQRRRIGQGLSITKMLTRRKRQKLQFVKDIELTVASDPRHRPIHYSSTTAATTTTTTTTTTATAIPSSSAFDTSSATAIAIAFREQHQQSQPRSEKAALPAQHSTDDSNADGYVPSHLESAAKPMFL